MQAAKSGGSGEATPSLCVHKVFQFCNSTMWSRNLCGWKSWIKHIEVCREEMMKSTVYVSQYWGNAWSKDWGKNQTKRYELICKFFGVSRCGGNCIYKCCEKESLLESSYQDGHAHNKSRWQNVNSKACCCRFCRCRWCWSAGVPVGGGLTRRCASASAWAWAWAWRGNNHDSSVTGAAFWNHHGQKAHDNQKY